MRLETAVYGEVNKGHALRATSGEFEFARNIAGRFDLPSSPPPGVGWSPAISGFPLQGRYVLARTFLDTHAPRGNMVLAHALFAPLDAMQNFSAIGRLIGRLAPTADEIPPVTELVVEDGEDPLMAADLLELSALLFDRGKKPVIRLGSEGFEALVTALWRRMWPSMRRGFAFRLSFAPDDLVESPIPALVYTPASLAVRWRSFPILGKTGATDSRAARLLSGIEDAEPLAAFAKSIGHSDASLATFPHLVQAETLLTGAGGIEGQIQALRLVNFLSPDPIVGAAAKTAIVSALSDAIASAGADAIMLLRNLTLDGISDLQPLWRTVSRWLAERPLDTADTKTLLPLLIASRDAEQAVPTWRTAVEMGSKKLAVAQPRAFALVFWLWYIQNPASLPALLAMTPRDPATQALLLRSMPTQVLVTSRDLLTAWLDRGWLTLHGATLASSVEPAEAVRAQLLVDKDSTFVDGLRAALHRAKPNEILAIAADIIDDRLDNIAGATLAADRRLAKTLDLSMPAGQRFWAAAIRIDPASWQAPEDPYAARRALLDQLLGGGAVFAPLLNALSNTPLSNLLDFPRRGEIWSLLQGSERFLAATAQAWLARAATGEAEPLDAELERVVLEPRHLDLALALGWVEGLNIISALEPLNERRAMSWFEERVARGDRVTKSTAELLGNVILARRWSLLLSNVRDRLDRHTELRATLRICAPMLSILARWSLGLSEISREEKWDSFATLASTLYPAGPGDRDLWERAGGDDAELLTKCTGADGWRHALRRVRLGHKPKAGKLLEEMQKDYRSNLELRLIAGDRDVAGW